MRGPGHFVPSGVDAQSWIGFEHRIQERRFRALLGTMTAAIASGDGVGARMALEEARELRPDAPELEDIADQVALLPVAVPEEPASGIFWSRTTNAVGLFLIGVALLVTIDWARPSSPAAETPGTSMMAPVVQSPDLLNLAVEQAPSLADDAPRITPPPPPTPASTPAAAADVPNSAAAIGTIGRREVVTAEEESVSLTTPTPVILPAVRIEPPIAAATSAVIASPPSRLPVVRPSGEVPDDYVAPQPPRETLLAARPAVSSRDGRGLEPVPAEVGAPERAPAVAAAAAIAAPREDETGVASVLNQYARAYGQLNASAARAVYPSVDERKLARAFASLESQNVSFDGCNIDVRGQTANASCRGRASYVGKIGSRQMRTEPRHWQFALRRDGEAWKIESAEATVAQ